MFRKFASFLSSMLLNTIILVIVLAIFGIVCVSATLVNTDKQINECKVYYAENYVSADNCYIHELLVKNETAGTDGSESIKQTFSNLVSDCLELFPEKVQSAITENWSIVFTPTTPSFATEYLNGYGPDENAGVTVPDIQTVFVYTNDVTVIPYVLAHELSHVVAFEYGCVEYTKEFENMYFLFKNTYKEPSRYAIPGYAVSSSSEFFASTLSTYVTDSDQLWLEAPGVADYMENLLSKEPYKNNVEKYITRTLGLITSGAYAAARAD